MSSSPAPGGMAPAKSTNPVAQLLRDLVHDRTGIFFEPERTELMLEKLEPRRVACGCASFLDYYYVLKYDEKGAEEWHRVLDAFSVQETYFWREFDQIRVLSTRLAPEWWRKNTAPFRVWSAACATGEEPYSIAMALAEAGRGNRPVEIFASDAADSALTKARAASYRERSFRSLPGALREKYFQPQGETSLLNADVRAQVTFQWANLVALDEAKALPRMNVIFCRNVFIYFSPATIKRVVASFAQRLPLGGHLFVGASESLLKLTDQFDLEEIDGAFVYVRNSAP